MLFDAPPAISAPAPEEMIVTASRRAEPSRDEPAALARLTRAELSARGPVGAVELLRAIPGVSFQQNNGVENLPALRSPVLNGGAAAGSILVLQDGVPLRAPGFGNVNQVLEADFEFAAAVEATRGPGSAVYGSNALNGVINVLSPGLAEAPAIAARLEYGRFGRRYAEALVRGGPVYLGVSILDEGGYREAASVDQQKILLASDFSAGAARFAVRASVHNLAQETAGFVVGESGFRDRTRARANPNPNAFRDQTTARVQVDMRIALGDRLELAVTPFGRWIDTRFALSFLPSEAIEETGQVGGGVQSALYWDPNPRASLIVGLDGDRTQGRLREEQFRSTVGTFVQGLHYDYVVQSRALAGFGQVRLEPAAGWRIDMGVRAEQVAFEYDNRAPDGDIGRFRRPADRRDAFLAVSPKFGVSRRLSVDWTGFLNYRRGARPPQASDLYALQIQQRPGEQGLERLDQVEGGVRYQNSAARVELVAFWAGRRGGSFRNADGLSVVDARTRGLGVELAYSAPLFAGLRLEGWVSRAEHTYRFEDRVTSPSDSIAPGALVDTAPRWLAQNTLAWSGAGPLSLRLDWRYNGSYFTNAANSARQEGFNVLDLRAGFALARGVESYVLLRNALDARYPERADFAFGSPRFFPGEPIAFRLGLALRR